MKDDVKQGGFSDGVWNSDKLQKYVKSGFVCGYIGSSYRIAWADKIVESELRASGLKDNGIGLWLTSTDGRHLADNIGRGKHDEFAKLAKSYCKDAFERVSVWSHPDHGGSYQSTLELMSKFRERFSKGSSIKQEQAIDSFINCSAKQW